MAACLKDPRVGLGAVGTTTVKTKAANNTPSPRVPARARPRRVSGVVDGVGSSQPRGETRRPFGAS